ncbi:YqhR family membrane protein [Oceanobacillus sp. CAU 1775]
MSSKMQEIEQPSKLFGKMIITGIFGGVTWSIFFVFMYLFSFSEVAPYNYILEPWLKVEWADKWQGHLLSIGLAGIISIIPSIIYYFTFKRINSMWAGVFYGALLWVIFFIVINHLIIGNSINDLPIETIITTISVFILYGTFIGYTISYDYYLSKRKLWEARDK